MRRRKAALLLIAVLANVCLLPGCASFLRGELQGIPVTSSPVGAEVFVNGARKGVTPLELRLVRKLKNQIIRIESPGYNPVEIRLERWVSPGPAAGNFLLGLIPGGAIAAAWSLSEHDHGEAIGILSAAAFGALLTAGEVNGSGCELDPKELTVTLTKAEGPPKVEAVLVATDDLRNIKWLRVRAD